MRSTTHQDGGQFSLLGQRRFAPFFWTQFLGAANDKTHSMPYALAELSLRAYVRHAGDYPTVQAIVEEQVGADASVVYVQADICRSDLLVEVEAMASHTLGNC